MRAVSLMFVTVPSAWISSFYLCTVNQVSEYTLWKILWMNFDESENINFVYSSTRWL